MTIHLKQEESPSINAYGDQVLAKFMAKVNVPAKGNLRDNGIVDVKTFKDYVTKFSAPKVLEFHSKNEGK